MEDYENITVNFTIDGNYSEKTEIIFERIPQFYYKFITIPLLVFCAFSVLANALILASLRWIRRPLSPTLHISLSLAGADMFTSLVIGVGLVVNSLLPQVFSIQIDKCSQLVIEALRMGGMYTSIGHLLTLAVNHYLGIKKPLHYPSLMTTRNITVIVLALWIIPPSSFAIYFSLLEQDGFAIIGCDYEFITRAEFRSSCCYIFLVCLITMAAIYSHIYLLVRQHQANRNRFRRVGSSYSRNPTSANDLRQSRNEKALRTTLLIVGTVVLGWLPATIHFYLVCDNCFIKLNWGTPVLRIITSALVNFLILLKTALNSCIYAARMHEIKAAIRLMRDRFITCCKFGTDQNEHNGLNSESSRHFVSRASIRPSRGTVLCRLQSLPRNESSPRQHAHYTTNL